MKIAILSDIHGNIYALKEVLCQLSNFDISRIFVLGDIVGYYYHSYDILDILMKYNISVIRGNHEDILERYIRDNNGRYRDMIDRKYGLSFHMLLENYESQKIDYFLNLPRILEVEEKGVKMLLSHGSPWDTNVYIYPDAKRECVDKFNEFNYDFIFCGHTHYPCLFRTERSLVINPGSVGQNRVKGGIASWVILDISNFSIQFKSTSYNTSILINEVLKYDSIVKYNYEILNR